MTPRDRVLAAIRGEMVFPVPVDVFENGIHWDLEKKLCRHFGLKENDHEGVLRRLGACFKWGWTAVYRTCT